MGEFPLSDRWATELIAYVVPLSAARAALPPQRAAIANLLYRMHMLCGATLEATHRRVMAGYTLLNSAFIKDPAATARIVNSTFERLGELQQRESGLFGRAWNANKRDLEEYFGSQFVLYDMTYERFYRTLASPYVVADAITRTGQSTDEFMDADGRVGPQRLAAVEAARGLVAGTLSEGVDSHLRNAAAHHQYDVIGPDRVRVWDQDPRSRKVTWGPHEWSFWDMRERVHLLSNTGYALLLGIAMFDLAHRGVIYSRFQEDTTHRRRRRDVIESELNEPAHLHGFSVVSVDEEASELLIVKLRVVGRTEAKQDRQIFTGGGNGPGAMYLQRVETLYAPLARQVLGLVQMSLDSHVAFQLLRVVVQDKDGKTALGEITLSAEQRGKTISEETWEQVLASVQHHTLADRVIPVIIEYPVQRIG